MSRFELALSHAPIGANAPRCATVLLIPKTEGSSDYKSRRKAKVSNRGNASRTSAGDTSRFRSIKQAVSYCGLCGAEKSSADRVMRTPISKQRNKHIQRVLVEAARMAPRFSDELAAIYERERQRGNANRATLAVARKMVAHMLAVDRRKTDFIATERFTPTAAA